MSREKSSRLVVLLVVSVLAGCRSDGGGGEPASPASPRAATELPNPFPAMSRPWGELPGGAEWGQVSAIAVDRDGRHLWVADRCGAASCVGSDRATVLKLDPSGRVVTSFGAGLFIRPHGVFVDGDGNIWVTDHRDAGAAELARAPEAAGRGQQVFKFSPEGEILLALGIAGEPGDPPARLNNPTDVIVASDGHIFVSEGHSNANPPGRISKFAPDGTFLMSWGTFGEGPGEFRTPHGLAFDSHGRLFVADRGNNRVQIFDQAGRFLEEWRQFGRPNDVFIGGDDSMIVIDSESSDEANPGYMRGIYIGSARTGEVTGYVPAHPNDTPYGTHGEGVAVDAAGNLYVAEVSIRGMTRYSPR
ncbi:MAG: peptidyl-alpha-hydroxyglycine alpha-amidating lyase family protein [Gemmatimonadota bacterium]